jgi:hypothetical protein
MTRRMMSSNVIDSVMRRLRGGSVEPEIDENRPRVVFVMSDHPMDNDKPTGQHPAPPAHNGEVRVEYVISGYTTLKAANYPAFREDGGAEFKTLRPSANEIAEEEAKLAEDDPWVILSETVPELESITIKLMVAPEGAGKKE